MTKAQEESRYLELLSILSIRRMSNIDEEIYIDISGINNIRILVMLVANEFFLIWFSGSGFDLLHIIKMLAIIIRTRK